MNKNPDPFKCIFIGRKKRMVIDIGVKWLAKNSYLDKRKRKIKGKIIIWVDLPIKNIQYHRFKVLVRLILMMIMLMMIMMIMVGFYLLKILILLLFSSIYQMVCIIIKITIPWFCFCYGKRNFFLSFRVWTILEKKAKIIPNIVYRS